MTCILGDQQRCAYSWPLRNQNIMKFSMKPILYILLGAAIAFVPNDALSQRGKKSKKGFYLYKGSKAGSKIDPTVYKVLGIKPDNSMPAEDIVERSIVQLLNEAVLSLEDGTIRCPRDGDIGAIFGIGFAPFRGGPFRYIDTVGAATVVAQLKKYQEKLGDRFKPSDLLIEKANKNEKFYTDH